MDHTQPTFVTQSFLPPIEEYEKYLNKIWHSNQLTNQGPLLREFEMQAAKYLGIKSLQFVSNGTIALQLALRALDITEGEVITTPFSYVATTSAILWERCEPVFVDIEAKTFCIDPSKIESAITPRTKAILAVHVFGNPCNIEAIEALAKRHHLKVIYDGAHAFGVTYRGRSLLDYGDISICSFHATKPFHTIEGGAVVTRDEVLQKKVDLLKRFGHNHDEHIQLGINAKSSEFQAAMGLCNLKYIDDIIARRRQLSELYTKQLSGLVTTPAPNSASEHNYSYYPVLFRSEAELLRVKKSLEKVNVFCRRYFYPALNTLPYISRAYECAVAEDTAARVLCLPLYDSLSAQQVEAIAATISVTLAHEDGF